MKAINLTNKNPGGKREKLINKLPLETPYIIQIFPSFNCPFKCFYCGIFNTDKKDDIYISSVKHMSFELYKKCVDDMKKFKNKIKVVRFVGIGEPLTNPSIYEMIKYTKESDVANIIEIITNGYLLNPENSEKLIDSGVDRIVISLQGINSESYKEISGIKIDFNKFVSNIGYLYSIRKDAHIYIKIADLALKDNKEKEEYFNLFGNICDSIAIEHIAPLHDGVDLELKEDEITQFGGKIKNTKICSVPFYMIQVNPDGACVPCYNFNYPVKLGNIRKKSLVDIWKDNIFRKFMIQNTKNVNRVCNLCTMETYRYHKEDDLDNYVNKLKKIY